MTQSSKDTDGKMDEKDELEHKVDQTTTAIVDKLQRMEDQLRGTVGDAKVLLDSASGAIKEIKNSLDLKKQIEEHPTLMLAGAVAAGIVVANFGTRSRARRKAVQGSGASLLLDHHLSDPSIWEKIEAEFSDEVRVIKRLALAVAVNFLKSKAREWVKDGPIANSVPGTNSISRVSPTPDGIIH